MSDFFSNISKTSRLSEFQVADAVTDKSSQLSAFSSVRTGQDTVFVDVGSRRIAANVTRDGLPVGIHTIDPDIFKDVIIDRPISRYTIVRQSIAPGTPVAVGSTIDVSITQPGRLPVGVITGTLTAFKERKMDESFQELIAGNATARRIIARAGQGPISSDDEVAVREIFAAHRITLDDQPGNDIDAALTTLNVLNTFGGS